MKWTTRPWRSTGFAAAAALMAVAVASYVSNRQPMTFQDSSEAQITRLIIRPTPWEGQPGVPHTLVIEGSLRNTSARSLALARVLVTVKYANGTSITTSAYPLRSVGVVSAGEEVPFVGAAFDYSFALGPIDSLAGTIQDLRPT